MRIIVEGVNASGKSTLCNALSKKFGLDVVHAGPKPKTDTIAIRNCFEQHQMRDVIFDRVTCVSRQIYGDNKEQVSGLSARHIAEMNKFVGALVPTSIFILTTGKGKHIIKDYYSALHIQEITKNRYDIKKRYSELFEGIPHIEYDFREHSIKDIINLIENNPAFGV